MVSFSVRTAAAVAAAGALAFAGAGIASAQDPIQGLDTGSLGSLTGLFVTGADGQVGGSIETMVGSLTATEMQTSATGSVTSGSLKNAQDDVVAGSSEGSVGSIGDLAGQINGENLDTTGSNAASTAGSSALKVVDSESATGVLKSASLGIENITTP